MKKSKNTRSASILTSTRALGRQSIKHIEACLKNARKRQEILNRVHREESLVFRVKLTSMWEHDGEKSVTYEAEGMLQDIIQHAEAKFMKVNHRGDIQADYSIEVVFPDLPSISLPNELWAHLRKRR